MHLRSANYPFRFLNGYMRSVSYGQGLIIPLAILCRAASRVTTAAALHQRPQLAGRLTQRMAFAGKVAVVTGSNQGIGLETLKLISPKVDVAILATRSAEKGTQAAETLKEEGFKNVVFKPLDLASSDSIASFVSGIKEEYGKVDILVNNAGTAFKGSDPTPFRDQAEPTLKVNFFRTIELTEALIPLLREAEAPRVVNVCSQAGHLNILRTDASKQAEFASPELRRARLLELMQQFQDDVAAGRHSINKWPGTCYGMSKLGLVAYTKLMAREEGEAAERVAEMAEDIENRRAKGETDEQPPAPYKKVFFAACCPGWCATSMSSYSGPRPAEVGARTPAWLALGGGSTPGGFYFDEKEIMW